VLLVLKFIRNLGFNPWLRGGFALIKSGKSRRIKEISPKYSSAGPGEPGRESGNLIEKVLYYLSS
jgi:hypothetical protein